MKPSIQKLRVENQTLNGSKILQLAKSGRLKIRPRDKSPEWDAAYIAGLLARIQPGHFILDERDPDNIEVIEGNARLGAFVDFFAGKVDIDAAPFEVHHTNEQAQRVLLWDVNFHLSIVWQPTTDEELAAMMQCICR